MLAIIIYLAMKLNTEFYLFPKTWSSLGRNLILIPYSCTIVDSDLYSPAKPLPSTYYIFAYLQFSFICIFFVLIRIIIYGTFTRMRISTIPSNGFYVLLVHFPLPLLLLLL